VSQRKRLRILIVDDHDLLRMSLSIFFETQEDMLVVGEASDGQQAVQLASQLRPDVIIMDRKMPHLDGVTATHRIKQAHPSIHILILMSDASEEQR
jgi:DNA-binding NarL/FixJ family response regulator